MEPSRLNLLLRRVQPYGYGCRQTKCRLYASHEARRRFVNILVAARRSRSWISQGVYVSPSGSTLVNWKNYQSFPGREQTTMMASELWNESFSRKLGHAQGAGDTTGAGRTAAGRLRGGFCKFRFESATSSLKLHRQNCHCGAGHCE